MFSIPCTEENKKKLIQVVNQSESFFCLLNSNQYIDKYSSINWKLAYGNRVLWRTESKSSFQELSNFKTHSKKPIYGLLTYDLKNEVEKLSSKNIAHIEFPAICFFEEEVSIKEKDNLLVSNSSIDFDWVENEVATIESKKTEIIHHVSKTEYLENVKKIKQHILEGDVYELNYCIPFEIKNTTIDPIDLYFKLNERSPNPFSGILKLDHLYILSASPERYLRKIDTKLISQPIKGTIKRTDNIAFDKEQLLNSEKERAENVMIVDLVRNDLTRTAITGSINVEELFGIYTFPQLHQMISTVSSEIDSKYNAIDAIKTTFPMGSMTGAPKVKAMELIEQYESFKRGAYSGAMGYIDEENNFDFNVLIRSVFMDTKTNTLCFNVGSAITLDSNAEEEYEECLLKAQAILEVLGIGYRVSGIE